MGLMSDKWKELEVKISTSGAASASVASVAPPDFRCTVVPSLLCYP